MKIRILVRSLARRSEIILLVFLLREIKCRFNQKYYSQFEEDRFFDQKFLSETGYFLDIGCGRPVTGSNTYGLYRKGWTGAAIDPLKTNQALFKILRKRDRFICAVVGSQDEFVEFFEFHEYVYSTFDKASAEDAKMQNGANLKRIVRIPSHRLNSNDLEGLNRRPSLLSIDCEGMDFEVLKSIDLNAYKPQVICVELYRSGSKIYHEKIIRHLAEFNYKLTFSTELNGIFELSI